MFCGSQNPPLADRCGGWQPGDTAPGDTPHTHLHNHLHPGCRASAPNPSFTLRLEMYKFINPPHFPSKHTHLSTHVTPPRASYPRPPLRRQQACGHRAPRL